MRLAIVIFAALALVVPTVATAQAQTYPARGSTQPPGAVIRPAAGDTWRNYVTVPDGPCGYPMSVEADCYNVCRPCGPLHPLCFLHRVGRMLDCLLPCNMCCRGGGGCGLFHGCILGGRTWGHCGVCCGGGGAGACGGCGGCDGGCCPNPCGSVFAPIPSCTTGGHCYGCSSAIPTLSDPFLDDPLPPKPTAQPATEVRRAPTRAAQPAVSQARPATTNVAARPATPNVAAARPTSPYKIVSDRPSGSVASRPINRQGSSNAEPAASPGRKPQNQSVLRRASAEQSSGEPAQFEVDRSRAAAPIIRSQSPDESSYEIPRNPLRK